MRQANRYQGRCFCGEVQFELTGDPVAMGYCHCESCRHWSAGPVNAFSLWAPDALRLTRGAERLESFNKTLRSTRKWCATCGGHLFTEHPEWNLVDVYAAVISDFDFQPAVHVNYQETVLPTADGLPKFKDVPADMGGSGITLEE